MFLFSFFSCLTLVRNMGLHDYGVPGNFFLNGGEMQDGRHLCKAKQQIVSRISTEAKQINNFGVYRLVFRYT